MRTVYGKLTSLIVLLLAALLLFIPMRSGMEDHLYAYPRNLRMNKGDSYTITCALDADYAQNISYTALDENIARVNQRGEITAVSPGSTDIHLLAEGGARTTVHVEVVGTPTTVLALNTETLRIEKGQVSGLSVSFNDGADDTRIEWRSEDPTIAEVDPIGRVTALRGGNTLVYAVAPNGLRATANVFVHVSGDAVRITPEELTVGTGASLRMHTYYLPEDTTDEVTHWSSNDESLLTVDDDGTLHAVGVGQAVLSVFTQDGLSASTVINIERAASGFDVSPSAVTVERGDDLTLTPRFLDEAGNVDSAASEHYISWQSSNPAVATVENGKVKALRSGSTTISATADGMTATCELRVQVLVHEITLDQKEVYLLRQDTVRPIQLHAAIQPQDPDDPTITWSTNNDMVAYVDQTGLVTMTGGYGTAVITARAASGAEARFVVNVVDELPDPNAEPTPDPFATEAPETVEPDETDEPGGFSFDDIGNGVEARRGADDLTGDTDSSTNSGTTGSSAPAGFSFDDIGNGVEARASLDDDDTVPPSPTPVTNMSQEAEAQGLF